MFLLVFPVFVAVIGWVVQALWNSVVVEISGARPMSFWQALGLLLLCRILLGRWGRGGRGPWSRVPGDDGSVRDRWRGLSPAQRDQLRDRWRARCAGSTPRQDADAPNVDRESGQ
ncbi:MAG: hypothetical protein AB7H94_24660 [Lautropia sp.]